MRKALSKKRCTGCAGAVLPSFLAVALLGWAPTVAARDYKVDGGVSVGYERYDRQYDKNKNLNAASGTGVVTTTEDLTALQNDEYDRFRVAPLIDISSVTARDEVSFHYSPSFHYDYETYDHDVDHDLSAKFNRFLTRNWQLKLSEKYLLTDAALDQSATKANSSVQLSDNTGRRKYRTNDLGFVSEYRYWEDSLFTLGYTYDLLDNIDVKAGSGFQNYDRHEASLSVVHRFDSIWKLTATAKYVRGLYDTVAAEKATTGENIDQDLSEYRASTMLESSLIDHHPLSLTYSYLGIDYDQVNRDSSFLHDVTAGWRWEVSKDFQITLGGGPSYQVTEGKTGNWGYNANAGLKYTLEHSTFEVTATHGYDWQNFTGTNDNGLLKFSQARIDYQYEILKDLTLRMFTSYRYEDQEEIISQRNAAFTVGTTTDNQPLTETTIINRQRFAIGTSAGYHFWRWYTLNLSYDYSLQDSEKANDSYDEHRVVLSLLMEKNLFSW